MKALNLAGALSLGFLAGALLGFTWAQGARSRLSESVTTDISGGVLSVSVDVKGAALGALADSI